MRINGKYEICRLAFVLGLLSFLVHQPLGDGNGVEVIRM